MNTTSQFGVPFRALAKKLGLRLLHLLKILLVAFPLLGSFPLLGTASAEQPPLDEIPDELRPWIPWVLSNLGDQVCASIGETKTCQWPGLLELDLHERGGTFRLSAELDAPSPLTLGGGPGAWPQDVHVDGKRVPVLTFGEAPAVRLDAGRHVVSGEFSWNGLPETLEVGDATAFVQLTVAGKRVSFVKREGGKLWLKGLGDADASSEEPEHIELSVFRQVRDGVPVLVETRLVFQVAGKPREVTLPKPLLPDTLPLSVHSDLALALEPSGDLRVQLVAGRHEVTLLARHLKQEGPLSNVPRPSPWPTKEIWTFRPNPELRSVELSGLAGIDASRTELPSEWRQDSAYVASPEGQLSLKTTRRGQEQIPDNRINLSREFWLDEEARAFTVRDRLSGEMNRGFRLNLLSGSLGSVDVSGVSQVITKNEGATGIEVRDAALDVTTVSRVPKSSQLKAVGWSEDAQSLDARLYLPPGWDVLFATGVDHTSRTWLARWDLFDVFYLLIVSFGLWRLAGPSAGIIAAIALLLIRGEDGAPEYLWLPLVVLAALLHLLSAGRIRSWLSFLFSATALLTVVFLVAFSVTQVRNALYPHLGHGLGDSSNFEDLVALPSSAPPPPEPEMMNEDMKAGAAKEEGVAEAPMAMKLQAQPKRSAAGSLDRGSATRTSSPTAGYAQKQFHADAVAQTGPGIPEAGGDAVHLSWTGPVAAEHEMALYLLSPTVSRLLTVLRLIALWGLAYVLFRFTRSRGTSPKRPAPRTSTGATAALLIPFFMLAVPEHASADEPSDARLSELKERLTREPDCLPQCVSVSHMRIQLNEKLRISVEVHAGARSVYRLPGPAKDLYDALIRIDGKPATALRLEEDGSYYLRLEKGVFEVVLEARLSRERITLDVGTPPETIQVETKDWSVSGINEHGRAAGGALTFQREASFEGVDADSEPDSAQIAVPAFYSVERRISIGVTGAVSTRILRRSDASSPQVLRLPLLPGEQLTTTGIEVENGFAEVSFPREETEKNLISTLSLPQEGSDFDLELVAPNSHHLTETWLVECGVVFHCRTEGLVPTSLKHDGRALSTFSPFPQDRLTIHATVPQPADGASVTVQKATYTITPGSRTSRGRLEMAIQASRSVVHTVAIPKDAKLEVVRVGEVPQAVKSQDGKVRVSLGPGRSLVVVEWQQKQGLSAWFGSPPTDAGAAGVNFRTTVELPPDRWLLATGGPSQGPALLFWGYLILIAIASILLPRVPYAPLKWHQWLLLGLGLTQVPAAVAVFVAGWFFAIASRQKLPRLGRHRQNLVQLVLVFYTIAFLAALTGAVYEGLIGSPDMEVRGAGSYDGHLSWYRDRSTGTLPAVWVFSLSLWVWRAFMLAWALWLSRALLAWLKWAWQELNAGGFWVPSPPKIKKSLGARTPSTAETSTAQTSAAQTSAAQTSAAQTSTAETSTAETSTAETSPLETPAPSSDVPPGKAPQ